MTSDIIVIVLRHETLCTEQKNRLLHCYCMVLKVYKAKFIVFTPCKLIKTLYNVIVKNRASLSFQKTQKQ